MKPLKSVTTVIVSNYKFSIIDRIFKMSTREPDISSLKELGLTENQAKAIIGMVKIGVQSDATSIAKVSNVPRSKIYFILQQLTEIGLIESFQIEGSVNYYKCLKIESIISRLKELSDQKIKKIAFALDATEQNLRRIENTESSDSNEKLDFVAIKGRDRIFEQITDLIDSYSDPNIRIIVNLPFFTYKAVSLELLDKLENKCKKLIESPNLEILVNKEEFEEIRKIKGPDFLKNYFLVAPLPLKDKKLFPNPVKLPITEPSNDLLTNLSNIFESRPFFMIIGTESAIIIIEKDYTSTALCIQNKTFLQFQQDIISSLFAVIKQFGKGSFVVK